MDGSDLTHLIESLQDQSMAPKGMGGKKPTTTNNNTNEKRFHIFTTETWVVLVKFDRQ